MPTQRPSLIREGDSATLDADTEPDQTRREESATLADVSVPIQHPLSTRQQGTPGRNAQVIEVHC